MPNNDLDPIKKKLDELDNRLNTTSYLIFSYLHALLALLNDKELTNQEEFKEYLGKCKQEIAKMMQDAQFLDTMKDLWPKDEKDDK